MKKIILSVFYCLTILSIATGCNKNTLGINEVKETLETRYNITINSIEENEFYKEYSNLVSSYKVITKEGKNFYAGLKKITIGGFEPDEYEIIDNFQFIELRKQINNKYNNLYWENFFLYKEIESNDISALSWDLHIKLNNENDINYVFTEYQDILNELENLNLYKDKKSYSLSRSAIIFLCDGNKGKTDVLENGKEYLSQEFYKHYLDEENELTLEQLKTEYYNYCN